MAHFIKNPYSMIYLIYALQPLSIPLTDTRHHIDDKRVAQHSDWAISSISYFTNSPYTSDEAVVFSGVLLPLATSFMLYSLSVIKKVRNVRCFKLTQNDDLCFDLCLTGATSVATPVAYLFLSSPPLLNRLITSVATSVKRDEVISVRPLSLRFRPCSYLECAPPDYILS